MSIFGDWDSLIILGGVVGGLIAFFTYMGKKGLEEIRYWNSRPCTRCNHERQEGEMFYGTEHVCQQCQEEIGSFVEIDGKNYDRCNCCKQWRQSWEVTVKASSYPYYQVCRYCIERSRANPKTVYSFELRWTEFKLIAGCVAKVESCSRPRYHR